MNQRMKVVLPVVVILAGIVATALLIRLRTPLRREVAEVLPPVVRVVTALRQPHQFVVKAQGTVEPRTEIQLAPEVSGRVASISPSLAAGGFFEQGEVLVTLESRDFELAVTNASARVAEARVRVQREQAEAEVALKEWESLGRGAPGPLTLREPQVAEARAALAAAEGALELAQMDLARTRVRAPFAGRVSTKQADVGQFVSRGTPVARIYAVDYAEVRLPLSMDDLAFVELPISYRGEANSAAGPAVMLSARVGGRSFEWAGRVVRTEGEIDSRTRMLNVVAQVDDPYGRDPGGMRPPLAAGMFVNAAITGKRVADVVVLPREALRGAGQVLVLTGEDRLQIRTVELLRAGRGEVVVSSGVGDGERVCVSPLDVVVEGMKVRPLPPEPGGQEGS